MTVRQTESAYNVGYGKPPRHTQFRKGQSGNPGGRPRREPVERLKALTLQEAYRGIVVRGVNGIAEPAIAIQEVLRSQIELAMKGNVRAQRDILNAVRTYEREDARAAALDEYVKELVQQGLQLEKVLQAAKCAAPPVEQKIDYAAAARRISQLLQLDKPESEMTENETAESETRASAKESVAKDSVTKEGDTHDRDTEERSTEESGTEESGTVQRNAVPVAPSADSAPQPENSEAAPSDVPLSPPLSTDPPAASPEELQPWRRRPNRHARHAARQSTRSPGRGFAGRGHAHQMPSRPGAAGGKNQKIPC